MAFADALHLAQSQSCSAMYTFDIKFVNRAKGLTECKVQHPVESPTDCLPILSKL